MGHGSISTHVSMYTADAEEMPDLAAKLEVSGSDHFFLRFQKPAFTGDGERVNTFGPRGLSGGALLDLGEFTSPEAYTRDPTGSALLCGMLIEYHSDHHALVAVRIDIIVNGIHRLIHDPSGKIPRGS